MGSRDREEVPRAAHEEFLELCALAASASLSESEWEKLQAHLAMCPECRAAFREFESIAEKISPELAPDAEQDSPAEPSFSQEGAEASFQKRLEEERQKGRDKSPGGREGPSHARFGDRKRFERFGRYEIWLPLVASILLCLTLGILSYRTGRLHGIEWARSSEDGRQVQIASSKAPATGQVRDVPPEKEPASSDAALALLRQDIARKSLELEKLKTLVSAQQATIAANATDKVSAAEERVRLAQQVTAAESRLHETQEQLKTLERQSSESVMHTATLENRIAALTDALEREERLTDQQRDLLAKDQDIRELIGARDLYITEIYDVDHNGDRRKAAGRVFYTRGKSLVFYAYDLKQSPGVSEASTFEAWAQQGPDWHQASKLGIFYEDNALKKRWMAKSNDKKALDQIDAVFITVEPNGGSERPTSKPLLFTYLKVTPNHP